MGKRLPMTPELERSIRAATGDETLDVSSFAVYETRALSTEPISQSGLHDGARTTHATLLEMAQKLGSDTVPLLIMHETYGQDALPIGRVFKGDVFTMPNGESELRSLFYIPTDKGSYAKDIDSGLIDEVSVGVKFEHLFCSECGFDFKGPDADWDNYWSLTCNEGHVIGIDGVHLRLVGLDTWGELSLVHNGAAKDARIMSVSQRKLSAAANSSPFKLAASTSPGALVGDLNWNSRFSLEKEGKLTPTAKEVKMSGDKNENALAILATNLAEAQAGKIVAENVLKDTQAALAKKDQELTAALGQVKSLTEASQDSAKIVGERDAALAQVTKAVELMKPHLEAAVVASGGKKEDAPTELADMVSYIAEKGMKLHQVMNAGGTTSVENKTDAVKVEVNASEAAHRAAFKTK